MRALLYHVVIWYIFRTYNEQVRVIRFVSLWTFITACLLCFLILGALLWPVVAHCLCATNSLPGSLNARACSPLCSITPTCSDLFPALYSDETNFQVFIVSELESHAPFLAAALRSQWMTGCALRVSDRAADQSLTSDELVFILFLHRVSGNSHLVTQSQWEVQENAFWGFFFFWVHAIRMTPPPFSSPAEGGLRSFFWPSVQKLLLEMAFYEDKHQHLCFMGSSVSDSCRARASPSQGPGFHLPWQQEHLK